MIVFCCNDLIFATKIRSAAEAIGIPCRPARDAMMLAARLDQVDDGKLNESVTGVVVDLDLGDLAIDLVSQVKAHDAALPVTVFGSHVETERLGRARDAGADFVMARSTFTEALPDVLRRLAGPDP
ncbi:MAG: hypothetical protein CMJ18_12110 [Phycisphaeraceae bacterium]|nr:hypothetical protein [Phycisphaeraceae bacterium]